MLNRLWNKGLPGGIFIFGIYFSYFQQVNLRKTISLCSGFYRRFAFFSALIAFCGIILTWEYGPGIFVGVFWLKVITVGLSVYHINTNRAAWFYYYHNLGMTQKVLWITTLLFDFILYLVLVILVNHFR